ncbi:MAG: SH3 domain-containing protein [Ancalomicrobiaceae bacterium]|nr:SH3 domain-containing protein [Ancalomicrobiaceae bacterium]
MISRSSVLMAGAILAISTFSTAAGAADGVATRSDTLRAGPGTSYPAVADVSSGDRLEIFGCLSGYSWCDVAAEADRGWIRGSRIDFLRNGTRYRISEGYSDFGLVIATFALNDYWGNYYGERPWFTDHRWRRGHNALPSNWQSNRPAWVHPNTVSRNPPHPGTPPGVAQPGGQTHPAITTSPRPVQVAPGQPRHPGPAAITPHANAPAAIVPHANAPRPIIAPHVNAPQLHAPQHQAPHNQPAARPRAPQPKLIPRPLAPAAVCQPPAKC